jgi:lipoprotein-releasing system permease protein
LNLPFFIARRNLLRRQGGFSAFIIRLAIVATALSVATMIITVAFVNGFKHEIREKLFSFWGHVHITPFTPNASTIITADPIKMDRRIEQQVAAMPHVKDISPFAVRPAIIHTGELMEGVQLKGVSARYQFPSSIKLSGDKIDYSDTAYAKEVVLSERMAARLKLNVGDDIQIYFLEPGSIFPRIRKVKVAGTFHTGMDEVDRDYGICDLRLLQRINNWQPDDINGYQVMLDNADRSDSVSARIFDRYLEAPLTTHTMAEIFPNIYDWLELQDVNARIIIIIMAIVAVMNLAVALLILIVEQARMVALLRTQGMTNGATQLVFLYYAALIAFAGIFAGNLVAIGICVLQEKTGFLQLSEASYYVRQVPVKLTVWHPLVINIGTLILCILCMWLPSMYIRRIQPARVLQFK